MSNAVTITMHAWPLVVLLMFMAMRPQRAVIVAFIAAWLFLPVASFEFPFFPDLSKMTATSGSVMLGAVVFDARRLFSFRTHWLDLPMLLWCLCPIASSMSNDLGIYDGVSASLTNVTIWGLPYLIGRIYLNDAHALRELAMGIFIGGLVYVPLCQYEMRMSPQLHRIIYGFHQHVFYQHMRLGGYRPIVFMQHGIMVATWMASASLAGAWLWATGVLKRMRFPAGPWLVLALLATTLLCKSIGAIVLLLVGLISLLFIKRYRTRVPILCLILVAPIYVVVRATGLWTGSQSVSTARFLTTEAAAESLAYRIHNEDRLSARALERPVFGWGGWGRSRVRDALERDLVTTDGLWIIILGKNGFVGLALLLAAILLPPILFASRIPVQNWCTNDLAAGAILTLMLCLWMIDCLPNAMVNPIYLLAGGGLHSLVAGAAHQLQSSAGNRSRPHTRPRRPAPLVQR